MNKFILEVPKWTGAINFDYAAVSFFIIICMISVCVAISFWGYKHIWMLIQCFIGTILAMTMLMVTQSMTSNQLLWMTLFTTFTFFSIAVVVQVFRFIRKRVENPNSKKAEWNNIYKISSIIGGITIAGVMYVYVFRSITICGGIGVIFWIIGFFWGKHKSKVRKVFYTYEDLANLEVVEEKG